MRFPPQRVALARWTQWRAHLLWLAGWTWAASHKVVPQAGHSNSIISGQIVFLMAHNKERGGPRMKLNFHTPCHKTVAKKHSASRSGPRHFTRVAIKATPSRWLRSLLCGLLSLALSCPALSLASSPNEIKTISLRQWRALKAGRLPIKTTKAATLAFNYHKQWPQRARGSIALGDYN